MKKRVVALFLTGVMLVSATGCLPWKRGGIDPTALTPPEDITTAEASTTEVSTEVPDGMVGNGAMPAWFDGDPDSAVFVPDATEMSPWMSAYYQKICAFRNGGTVDFQNFTLAGDVNTVYTIGHLNSGSVPALIVRFGECEADYMVAIYQYENDDISMVYSGPAGHCSYYDTVDGGILEWNGHMGYATITKMTYENGQLNTETLVEEELQGAEEYTKPAQVSPGATHISLIPLDNPLMLFLDGEQISTKSAYSAELVDDRFGKVIAGGESVYAVPGIYGGSGNAFMPLWQFMQEGYASQFYDLTTQQVIDADLNGDSQNECILVAGPDENSADLIILSLQGDSVYAYHVSYFEKDVKIEDGIIRGYAADGTQTVAVKVTFYKDLFYETYVE